MVLSEYSRDRRTIKRAIVDGFNLCVEYASDYASADNYVLRLCAIYDIFIYELNNKSFQLNALLHNFIERTAMFCHLSAM